MARIICASHLVFTGAAPLGGVIGDLLGRAESLLGLRAHVLPDAGCATTSAVVDTHGGWYPSHRRARVASRVSTPP